MSADASLTFRIEGRDEASAAVRAVTEAMKALEGQAKALGAVLGGSLGAELSRQLDSLNARAKALGTGMGEAGEKVAKALGADTTAARELRDALREVADAQNNVARGARTRASARSPSTRPVTAPPRDARPRAPQAEHDDFAGWRTRQRIKANSERIERQDAARERVATASAAAAQLRAEQDAFNTKLRHSRFLMGVRERSEAAEHRHFASIRRQNESMRRRAISAGHHALRHARHAINSVNHPALQSPGFWLHAGAVFGVEAGKHLLDAARSIDAATTRYRMMPGVSTADAAAVRANALREGMRIGLDPAEVVRLQLQGLKDGLSKDIAASLPAVVNAAVQTMGGSIDRDGDELAKAVREAFTVGWVRDPAGARSLMNSVAGLSTFNGNSPEKMNQFLASGGIGRGKELGWSKDQTLAFGAALNGSGERTGLGSARLMAQIPEIRAEMKDRFIKASRSHTNSEENRAARAAPRMMGYGSINEMQQAFATPEGVTDFLSRMSKLPEQTRAAIEKVYGLGPQFNAVAAEMGADHGARYKQAFKRETELSSQTAGNDDLAKNGKIWSSSIDFMIGQLKASVEAIQSELGDVIKDDILTPFTKWWVEISEGLLNGGMKADFHRAITGFVEGLGFSDVTAALNALRSSVGTFDFAGFMRGVGEGLRAFMDQLRSLAGTFGGVGGIDARTVGRLAAEMFGLSAALHVAAPIVTTIGGIASSFLALKSALEGVAWVARLAGITEALGAGGAIAEGAAGAGALGTIAAALTGEGAIALAIGALPITIATVLAGTVLAVTIANWPAIKSYFTGDGNSNNAAADLGPNAQVKDWRLKSVPGALRNDPSQWSKYLSPSEMQAMQFGPNLPEPSVMDRIKGLFHRSAYEGGEDPNNWRNLMTPAAYTTDDDASADDRDRNTAAMVSTSRSAQRIADRLDALAPKLSMTTSASAVSTIAGSGSGGGSGGAGLSNLRYGRTASGAYRSSPGGPGAGGGTGMTAVSKDLTPESRALLDTLASGEAPDYNVLNGGGRFSDYSRHPGGRAAGRYQFLPSTWRRVSTALGLKDFSPESQDKGAWWLAQQDYKTRTGRNLQSDLASKDPTRIAAVGRALHSTWVSLNGSFGGKYASYLGRQSTAGIAGGPGVAAAAAAGSSVRGLIHGNLSIGGESFRYGSGGAGGSSSIPFGDYPINPDAPGAWGRAHNAMAVNGTGSIYDKALGRMRTGIEMHAAHTAEMVTHGCLGFMAQEYPRLKARVRDMVAKYGHAYLHVGPNGATITPDKVTPASLADGAKALPKGSAPALHHAPVPHAAPMQTAQAAPVTVHFTNHFHGSVKDPRQHARDMMAEAGAARHRYSDAYIG